jgi:phage FluMu protein Com
METVNIQCGHCGNLMAVEIAFLGQQLRCPHCQEIVDAPVPHQEGPPAEALPAVLPSVNSSPVETPPVDSPAVSPVANDLIGPALSEGMAHFQITPPVDQDSIFSLNESSGDGLFDDPLPQVEMPLEAGWMPLSNQTPPLAPAAELPAPLREEAMPLPPISSAESGSAPSQVEETTASYSPEAANAFAPSSIPVDALPAGESATAETFSAPSLSSTNSQSSILPISAVRMPKTRPWLVPLLIIPLISYSILATIAAAILYAEKQRQVHPLEAIPDQGENKGATRSKTGAVRLPDPARDLPNRLKVALGDSIRIGDLEVTPEKVERRQIKYESRRQGSSPDPTRYDALALVLHLKNISQDVVFKPMDPYFTRQWKPKNGGLMPYTYLAVGDHHFYGGPLSMQDVRDHQLSVAGQDLDQELRPGEEFTTFICTDPDDPLKKALDRYNDSDPLLWRVQVRRGLVRVHERDVPATAVIGVQFSRKSIQ